MAKLVDLDGLGRYNTKLNEKLESTFATKGEVPSTENLATKDDLSSLTTEVQESFVAVDEKINLKATSSDLSTVATSGSYDDLLNKPEIPSVEGLATEDFVNSSISTNTATFKGTVDSVDALNQITDADENDYAFVVATDEAGNTQYNRYKFASGAWSFEYTLNNSSFTAEQWSAINSGITSDKITTMESNIENKVVKNADIASNTSYLKFPRWDSKGLITGQTAQVYQKNVTINGTNIGPLFGTSSNTVSITIPSGVSTISTQYIRITDLSTGMYKLTYNGNKYIYYYGETDTSKTLTVGPTNYGAGNFLLFVNKQAGNVWSWHYFHSTYSVSSLFKSSDQKIVYGTTSDSWGEYNSTNLSDVATVSLLQESYVTNSALKDKGYLTEITSDQVTSALGYTPYDSTNPNEYVTSSGSVASATKATQDSDGNQINTTYIKQGGTLSKPLKVTGGDATTAGKLILDETNKGQITNSSTATLFGFNNSTQLTIGASSYATLLRGSATRPTYNGNDLALKSDVPTTSDLLNTLYPIGSIYITTKTTTIASSPASWLGGKWTLLKDKFLIGAGGSYSLGSSGGSATVTLTAEQMPIHKHSLRYNTYKFAGGSYERNIPEETDNNINPNLMKNAGGGQAHDNMPPYIAVNMWERTE